MLNYCLSLFTYDIGNADKCLNTIKPMLPVYDNEILLAPFTGEEIENTVSPCIRKNILGLMG